AVLPAFAEEAMFRGFITTALLRYSPIVAISVSSLMFGLFHLEPTQAAGTVLLGVAFGLIRLYTGSIWPCVLSHGAYNAAVILEARWFEPADDHVIHWGRVGLGLVLALAAYALLVGDLWRRHLARLSLRPPAAGGGR
ncbi:MAG TPA: CPBP family intramembrane glutamic endopeptidase, partial [Polyangiaceae bacterium]